MTPQDLIASFEVLAEAPDGIQRLRELVLQLAVRGKLVPQDPDEEPTAGPLAEVQRERGSLLKAKVRGRPKVPRVPEQWELPHELPSGWSWARLDDTGDYINGLAFKPKDWFDSGLPIIRIQNLTNPANDFNYARGEYPADRMVQDSDILVSWSATLEAFIWDRGEAVLNQHIFKVVPDYRVVSHGYLYYLCRHTIREMAASEKAHGLVMKHINRGPFLSHVIALPPLAEQHRIVARVDALMAHLDRLEATREAREATRAKLRDAALTALRDADDAEEVETAWARIAENMDDLFTNPADVEPLRQAILQLAVRGRLVPQDPEDEPAEALLGRIAKEKARLVREGKIRRQEALPQVDEGKAPYKLPTGWRWVRFGDSHINRDSERIPLKVEDRAVRQGPYDYYGASGVIDTIDDYLFDGDLLLIGEDGANLVLRSKPIAFIAGGRFWVNNHAHVLDSVDVGSLRYLSIFVNAIDLRPYLTGTAQPKLNQAKMNRILAALPPLAEQHRIVARVEALMAYCDKLEARLTDTQKIKAGFASAAVHHLEA